MSGWNLPPGVSDNDPHINPPDISDTEALIDMLATALDGLNEYHKYGQAMRGIGKGYDWGEYPGETTLDFVRRAQALIDDLEYRDMPDAEAGGEA